MDTQPECGRKPYIVVFRYTKAVPGYHGVITWTCFGSKEEFDAWYTDDIRAREEVIAEGVTEERAVELTHDTPAACYAAAALEDSREPDGSINPDILRFKLAQALFASRL